MLMYEPFQIELAKIRLENAKKCLITAESNLNIGDHKAAANRAYYSIFNSMRAVLALDNYDSKKHSGIIAEFRKQYIKNGKFENELSEIISRLFDVRTEADYNDFYLISKQEVEEHIANARKFVNEVELYFGKIHLDI